MSSLDSPGARRLASLLSSNRALGERFAPPLPDADVDRFIQQIGVPLPPVLRELLRICDGSRNADALYDAAHVLPDDGLALLSLKGVAGWKTFWDDLARIRTAGSPFHHAFWNLSWVPLAMSVMNDVYALATEPCFGGPPHQVVRFNTEGDTHWTVVSDSLDDFLGLLASLMERGANRLDRATLLELNPRAREVELAEADPGRFERAGVLLADLVSGRSPEAPPLSVKVIAEEVARGRGIDPASAVETLRSALEAAARSAFEGQRRIEATFDDATGHVNLFMVVTVVENVEQPGREIALDAVRAMTDPAAAPGEEFLFQIFYLAGDEASAREMERSQADLLMLDARDATSLSRLRETYAQVLMDTRAALLASGQEPRQEARQLDATRP